MKLFLIYLFFERKNGIEPIQGLFRVKYKDGRFSQRMYYDTAYSYSRIFGGKVFFHKIQK